MKVIKFGIVGVLATIVHGLILSGAVELLHWNPILATPVAFVCAFFTSYSINSLWTFKTSLTAVDNLGRYFVVAISGLFLNMLIMYVSIELLQYSYQIGFAAAIVIVSFLSFLINSVWSFRQ